MPPIYWLVLPYTNGAEGGRLCGIRLESHNNSRFVVYYKHLETRVVEGCGHALL